MDDIAPHFEYYESMITLYNIGLDKKRKIEKLKDDLKLAIELENYEICCIIRDELNKY